jgi:hypothetical protein
MIGYYVTLWPQNNYWWYLYVAWNKMYMVIKNDELEETWKEAVFIYFKMIP